MRNATGALQVGYAGGIGTRPNDGYAEGGDVAEFCSIHAWQIREQVDDPK